MYAFLDNKYSRVYFSIVKRGLARLTFPSGKNKERHHIVPKCINGSNSKENLVELTVREHFICHLLLTRMTVGLNKGKMFYSLKAFSMKKGESTRLTSRFVEAYRMAYKNVEWNEWRKQRLRDTLSTPERRATKSLVAKKALGRPEVKKKLSDKSIAFWNSDRSLETRTKVASVEYRLRTAKATKAAMATPDIRERYLAGYNASRSNRQQKIAEAWKDPVKRQLRLDRLRATRAAKILKHDSSPKLCT